MLPKPLAIALHVSLAVLSFSLCIGGWIMMVPPDRREAVLYPEKCQLEFAVIDAPCTVMERVDGQAPVVFASVLCLVVFLLTISLQLAWSAHLINSNKGFAGNMLAWVALSLFACSFAGELIEPRPVLAVALVGAAPGALWLLCFWLLPRIL